MLGGVISSSFLLHATIQHHAKKYMNDSKDFVETFMRNLYVENYTAGFNNVNEGYNFYLKAKKDA